jgi:hypothetical protein
MLLLHMHVQLCVLCCAQHCLLLAGIYSISVTVMGCASGSTSGVPMHLYVLICDSNSTSSKDV